MNSKEDFIYVIIIVISFSMISVVSYRKGKLNGMIEVRDLCLEEFEEFQEIKNIYLDELKGH